MLDELLARIAIVHPLIYFGGAALTVVLLPIVVMALTNRPVRFSQSCWLQ